MDKKKIKIVIYSVFSILIFLLYLNIIKEQRYDFDYHVYKMFSDNPALDFYHQNNLFYYFMCLFNMILHIDLKVSASIILTLFMVFKLIVLDKLFSKSSKNALMTILLVCVCCISMSLLNPITHNIYLGQHVGNTWHNPPFALMLPFAIVCVELFIKCFIKNEETLKDLLLLSIMMLLSFLAKPSFIVSFIPSCGIYIIYKAIKKKNKKWFLNDLKKGLLICLPVLIYLVVFYFATFGNVQDKTFTSICVSPFGVWASYLGLNNISIDSKLIRVIVKAAQFLLSFVLANAFSITHIVFNKKWKDETFKYLLIMFGLGLFMFCVFAQTGDTYYDGNFSWNYAIGGLLLFIYCVKDLLENSTYKKEFYIELVICLLHAISGIYYLCLMLTDMIVI